MWPGRPGTSRRYRRRPGVPSGDGIARPRRADRPSRRPLGWRPRWSSWRPQRFGDGAARNIKDPIIEPLWVGTRAIVRVGFADRPEIADERGEPIVDVPAVVAQIETAALAASLVLDGYLTSQATRATEGVIPRTRGAVGRRHGRPAVPRLGGQRRRRSWPRRGKPRRSAASWRSSRSTSCWSMTTPLLDVPLLERKRILDGVLDETDLVRRTAYVRPPIDPGSGRGGASGSA